MTTEVSRRDIAKFAAALAVGVGMANATAALGQEAASGQEPKNSPEAAGVAKPADEPLAAAKRSPESYMLSEPAVFALDTDGHSRDLIITSARDERGNRVDVHEPSRSVRIFRADPTADEFASQGGLHWRFRDKPGTVKLNRSAPMLEPPAGQPRSGELVMIVRDDQTVRCYTMGHDLRC